MEHAFLEKTVFTQMRRNFIDTNKELSERSTRKDKNVVKIFACATMWHETESEMTGLLQSIFRMDKCVAERFV